MVCTNVGQEFTAYAWFKYDKYHDDAKIICSSDGSTRGVCLGVSAYMWYYEWWNEGYREYDNTTYQLLRGWNFAGIAARNGRFELWLNWRRIVVYADPHDVVCLFRASWADALKYTGTVGSWDVINYYSPALLHAAWIAGSARYRVHTSKWSALVWHYLSELSPDTVLVVGKSVVRDIPAKVFVNEPVKADLVVITDINYVKTPLAHLRKWGKYAKKYIAVLHLHNEFIAYRLGAFITFNGISMYNLLRSAGFGVLDHDKITGGISVAVGEKGATSLYIPRIITLDEAKQALKDAVSLGLRDAQLAGSIIRKGYSLSDVDIQTCENDEKTVKAVAKFLHKKYDFRIDILMQNKLFHTRAGIFNKTIRKLEFPFNWFEC